MTFSNDHPTPEILSNYQPLEELSSAQLKLLSQTLQIYTAKRGEIIIEQEDTTPFSLYLLRGSLRLTANDGQEMMIDIFSRQARRPIAQLLPRQYRVTALTQVEYLMLDNQLLEGLLSGRSDGITATEISEEEIHRTRTETENRLVKALYNDLEKDSLSLPSLPAVAVRIGQAMKAETTNANTLSDIIQTDPAITAKLIRTANSPLYAGVARIDTCSAAVVRLGSDTTHKLVLTFALKELFLTRSKILKGRMRQLWEHSVKVSAICYVLASISSEFNPEHALLAGLLHDIGVVAILGYAERYPEAVDDEEKLNQLIHDMRGRIGSRILSTWQFTDDLVMVTEQAENWLRNGNAKPDYIDLVIIAQLHDLIGTAQMQELPSLDQVPAFHKLGIGELTPEMSIKILDMAQDKIARVAALLRR